MRSLSSPRTGRKRSRHTSRSRASTASRRRSSPSPCATLASSSPRRSSAPRPRLSSWRIWPPFVSSGRRRWRRTFSPSTTPTRTRGACRWRAWDEQNVLHSYLPTFLPSYLPTFPPSYLPSCRWRAWDEQGTSRPGPPTRTRAARSGRPTRAAHTVHSMPWLGEAHSPTRTRAAHTVHRSNLPYPNLFTII